MARIDVSELITDPDFLDDVTLIRRTAAVNPDDGENTLTETPQLVAMVVQDGVRDEDLARVPASVQLVDSVTVYFAGELTAQDRTKPGGYSDQIEFPVGSGRRLEVVTVLANWMNWGQGYTKALAVLVQPHA